MRHKDPHEIFRRWRDLKFKERHPEYVGEWHIFLWPGSAGGHYLTGYRVVKTGRTSGFQWICGCAGFHFASKEDKPPVVNGTECYHIKQLKEQVEDQLEIM